ncbi:MAG: potassium channel protein [Chloroflexi bacterium]|nr:potassium channel protein [Chloroflexota bacterium]MDA1147286.1 potassium channel protein [Chloroflexota bacterium]
MHRLVLPMALLSAVFAIGMGWYGFVEGFTFLEAAYQTVTTLSTVGYSEVRPLDTSGRVFTMVFILAGLGLMFYTATAVVEVVVAGEVRSLLGRQRSGRKVRRMERHVIVCGFGRVGQEIAIDLKSHRVEFVVVDNNPGALREATELGFTVVAGDVTEETVLREAGVVRARALVAAADSDVGNTYTVLTARSLNPDLFIVARAGSANAGQRMLSAGASRFISPYQIAGRRMALSVVQPLVLDFVDTLASRQSEDDHILAELEIDEASGFDGRTIVDIFGGNTEVRLLGVEHKGGRLVVGPQGSEVLHVGDRLMVYGTQPAIEHLTGSQGT